MAVLLLLIIYPLPLALSTWGAPCLPAFWAKRVGPTFKRVPSNPSLNDSDWFRKDDDVRW